MKEREMRERERVRGVREAGAGSRHGSPLTASPTQKCLPLPPPLPRPLPLLSCERERRGERVESRHIWF